MVSKIIGIVMCGGATLLCFFVSWMCWNGVIMNKNWGTEGWVKVMWSLLMINLICGIINLILTIVWYLR